MNKLLALLVSSAFATCAFAADPAPAKTPSPAQKAQQEKMAHCNKDATGKKGDERKTFMKSCLSGGDDAKVSPAQQAQRDKMKACNNDATAMKGDERKKFMKTCLAKK